MLKRKEIEKRLKDVIEELNKYELPTDLYLILVGGASLILKHGLKRSTHDIDVAVRPYVGGIGDILAKKGFQVVAEAFLNLPPDYEERLEKVMEKGKVHILTLSPYDLAVSKISRGFEKDIEDVLNSSLIEKLDLNKLKTIYFEAINYWIGDRRKFIWAWENFEDELRKRLNKKHGKKALRKSEGTRRPPQP